MEFVNIHGQPVNTSAQAGKKPSRPKTPTGPYHAGWRVLGFSPEHLAQGREDHERQSRAAVAAGKVALGPFNEQLYMAQVKPKRGRKKDFEVHSSALQYKAMLEQAGWKGVEVVAQAKG